MTDTTETPRAPARPARPLSARQQALIDSDVIIVGERIDPLPRREAQALAFIREELGAGRTWPSLAQLASHLKVREAGARRVLEELRRREKIQVIAWQPWTGSGPRIPAQYGLVPGELTPPAPASEGAA